MKKLKMLWEKIIRDFEIYLTITIALAVSLLNYFSNGDQKAVSSAMLAVLALVSFSLLKDRQRAQLPITVSTSNDGNNRILIEYISMNKVATAKLVQYSGYMIQPVIVELLERGAKVELLLQSPSGALNEQQCGKIIAFQESVTAEDFRNRQNLSIRYYTEPASIKAVKLDDVFLSIGWYTYRNKNNLKNEPWLYGHNNAIISGRIRYVEMHDLDTTFNNQFNILWNSAIVLTLDKIKTLVERRRKELKKLR